MIEIDRRIFVSLNYDHRDGFYYVLIDQNFFTKFSAESDNDAIEKFNKMKF